MAVMCPDNVGACRVRCMGRTLFVICFLRHSQELVVHALAVRRALALQALPPTPALSFALRAVQPLAQGISRLRTEGNEFTAPTGVHP